jgi:hypothetical protein
MNTQPLPLVALRQLERRLIVSFSSDDVGVKMVTDVALYKRHIVKRLGDRETASLTGAQSQNDPRRERLFSSAGQEHRAWWHFVPPLRKVIATFISPLVPGLGEAGEEGM